MKLEMLMIGAVLFGLVFVLGVDIYSDMLSKYKVDIDTSTTFGKMSYNAKQIKDYESNMRSNIQGGIVTEENAVDDMIAGGYRAIQNNPYGAIDVAANATQTLMQETGMVPASVVSFLLLTLTILTTFAIIALVFRFAQR